jgi:hypothetical protein
MILQTTAFRSLIAAGLVAVATVGMLPLTDAK